MQQTSTQQEADQKAQASQASAETDTVKTDNPEVQTNVEQSPIEQKSTVADNVEKQHAAVDQTSTAPAPEWVTQDSINRQLEKVAQHIKDPVVGLYGPDSMMWKIGREVLPGFHSAGRALLLQLAHPWIAHGVDQHSATKYDPAGRAYRTFKNVFTMVYGSQEKAFECAQQVHMIHDRIVGNVPEYSGSFGLNSEYRANEGNAMMWVHSTLWDTAMKMYELIVEPVSAADKERYYQETKLFAYLFGVQDDVIPETWNDFVEYNQNMWDSDELYVTDAAKDMAKFVFSPPNRAAKPVLDWLMTVTAVTMPERLREPFGLYYDAKVQEKFDKGIKRVRRLQKVLPKRVRYASIYHEAMARIDGKEPDVITRLQTRALFGKWHLVS